MSDSDSEHGQENAAHKYFDNCNDHKLVIHKRVIKSEKDKRFEELCETYDQMNTAMKINDWVSVREMFDKINRQLEKKVTSVAESDKVTRNSYNNILVILKDFLSQGMANKEAKKEMSSSNAKALNSMNQKLKKNNTKLYDDDVIRENVNPEVTQGDIDIVDNKLKELLAARGRKGTGRLELVEKLTLLTSEARSPAKKLEILFTVLSAQVDGGHMTINGWNKCVENMFTILDMLAQNANIRLVDDHDLVVPETQKAKTIRIWGNLAAFVDKLDVEFFKRLQLIDPRSTREYVERLRADEPLFLLLAQNVEEYLRQVGDYRASANVALRVVEHVYYKPQEVYDAMRNLSGANFPKSSRALMGICWFLVFTRMETKEPRPVQCSVTFTTMRFRMNFLLLGIYC